MKINQFLLGVSATLFMIGPALAGEAFDTTTVGTDNSLSNGVGTTGPGMSGYKNAGTQDKPMEMTSLSNGQNSGRHMSSNGFSRRAVYNNNVDLAQPHIR